MKPSCSFCGLAFSLLIFYVEFIIGQPNLKFYEKTRKLWKNILGIELKNEPKEMKKK